MEKKKMIQKTASLALCLAMLMQLVGCGEQQDSNKLTTEQLSTAERITSDIIPEPNQPIDPMVNITTEQETEATTEKTEVVTEVTTEEPATQPQKQDGIKYTIYGNIDIYLPINIDDYIIRNDDNKPMFLLQRLAEEYGWELKGEESNIFTYDQSSDYRVIFKYGAAQGKYDDPVFGSSKPVETLSCVFGETNAGTINPRYEGENDGQYKGAACDIHSGANNFYAGLAPSSPSMAVSKDLLVIIAYIITGDYRNSGENPFYHIDGLMAFSNGSNVTNMYFDLPQ